MRRRITACIAQNGGQEIPTHFIESSVSICELIPPPNQFMQLCITKSSVILEIEPYVISFDFFSTKELSQRLQIFKTRQQRMILYYR